MAETAKRMGRPPGEPSKVVRLPLPVAALAKRLAEKSLRAGGYQRLPRCRGQVAWPRPNSRVTSRHFGKNPERAHFEEQRHD